MVNIGVVGCGYWGPKHIRVWHELAEANLTTVCDVAESRLQQVRTQYPYVNATTDFKGLLKDNVEAVVISTPVNTHYKLAKAALLCDKHVLIEKPITASCREALELIELAEKRKVILDRVEEAGKDLKKYVPEVLKDSVEDSKADTTAS